jgi:CRISPR-associated protein Cas2
LVCYDIADPKRLRQVARTCSEFGERLQLSVFACPLDRALLARLKAELLPLIKHDEDQILFARLDSGDPNEQVETIGIPAPERERVTIV